MLSTIKEILSEHNLSDQGGGNAHIASASEPKEGNFQGKIWLDTSTNSHHIYYDGRYVPINQTEVYGGMVKRVKASDGTFEIVEKLDGRGQVIHRSTLSSPNSSGKFTQRKIETNIGKSSQRTDNFTLTYDSDGDLISEKKK